MFTDDLLWTGKVDWMLMYKPLRFFTRTFAPSSGLSRSLTLQYLQYIWYTRSVSEDTFHNLDYRNGIKIKGQAASGDHTATRLWIQKPSWDLHCITNNPLVSCGLTTFDAAVLRFIFASFILQFLLQSTKHVWKVLNKHLMQTQPSILKSFTASTVSTSIPCTKTYKTEGQQYSLLVIYIFY